MVIQPLPNTTPIVTGQVTKILHSHLTIPARQPALTGIKTGIRENPAIIDDKYGRPQHRESHDQQQPGQVFGQFYPTLVPKERLQRRHSAPSFFQKARTDYGCLLVLPSAVRTALVQRSKKGTVVLARRRRARPLQSRNRQDVRVASDAEYGDILDIRRKTHTCRSGAKGCECRVVVNGPEPMIPFVSMPGADRYDDLIVGCGDNVEIAKEWIVRGSAPRVAKTARSNSDSNVR